ncbi:hypothetical protein BC828DRAFT_377200 [Blastocladiella britannica]|nr:hypothetical protein BC828DRAFT_377200 [Blastocladiella britannica]
MKMPLDIPDVVEHMLCMAAAHTWDLQDLAALALVLSHATVPAVLPAVLDQGHPSLTSSCVVAAGVVLPLPYLTRHLSMYELVSTIMTAGDGAALEQCLKAWVNRAQPKSDHFSRDLKELLSAASGAGRIAVLDWAVTCWSDQVTAMPTLVEPASVHGQLLALEWWWARTQSQGPRTRDRTEGAWVDPMHQLQAATDALQLPVLQWLWARRDAWRDDDGLPYACAMVNVDVATGSGAIDILDWVLELATQGLINMYWSPSALSDAAKKGHWNSLQWWWKLALIPDLALEVPLAASVITWAAKNRRAIQRVMGTNKNHNKSNNRYTRPIPFMANPAQLFIEASTSGNVEHLDWLWVRLPHIRRMSYEHFGPLSWTYFKYGKRSRECVREMLMHCTTAAAMDWWTTKAPKFAVLPDTTAFHRVTDAAQLGAIEWWEARMGSELDVDDRLDWAIRFWDDTAKLDWWWARRRGSVGVDGVWRPNETQLEDLCTWLFGTDHQYAVKIGGSPALLRWWWPRLVSCPTMPWNTWMEQIMATAAVGGCLEPMQWWWDHQDRVHPAYVRVEYVLAEALVHDQPEVVDWLLPPRPHMNEDGSTCFERQLRYAYVMDRLADPIAHRHVIETISVAAAAGDKERSSLFQWWWAMCDLHHWPVPGQQDDCNAE